MKKEKLLLAIAGVFLFSVLAWSGSGIVYNRHKHTVTGGLTLISQGSGRKWVQINNDIGYPVIVTSNTTGATNFIVTSTDTFSDSGTVDWYIKHSSSNDRAIYFVEGR